MQQMGLGTMRQALKDLFNSALDERMRGQDHLTFGEFVEFLARSPDKVADVPQVVGDKAAAPPVVGDEAAVSPVAADEAAAHPGIHGLVSKLEDPPIRSVRAAVLPRLAPPKAAVPFPESAPFREPTESAPALPAPPWPPALSPLHGPGPPSLPLLRRNTAVPLVGRLGTSGSRSFKGGLCHESRPSVPPSHHQRLPSPSSWTHFPKLLTCHSSHPQLFHIITVFIFPSHSPLCLAKLYVLLCIVKHSGLCSRGHQHCVVFCGVPFRFVFCLLAFLL